MSRHPPLQELRRRSDPPTDGEWWKDAIIYELHVRSFKDSTDDGVGDFPGLTSRLPYLRDLGVSALWLLPFYPSPLRDDGYDIADYLDVHPDYGTLADFDRFLATAHEMGLRVFTELVINHTSDQHPWFQRARTAAPGTPERDFYVWSDTPDRYAGTRVIFQDFERSNWTWDPVAQEYYWHRFYGHQPDLNYRNPQVLAAVLQVLDFWFGRGVDGMRLDALPYLVEEEGTTSENLTPTHDVLKAIRRYVDERYPGRAFLAEANQWPEDAVAYFGEGDESHLVFHFPLMPRLFMAVRQEDRQPIADILEQTPEAPDGGQWALFLRNHDELTLEMVTEEERLYMYDVYAADPAARLNLGIRRRLAPLLGNDRRRIELMNALLFSLPGTPIIYYGDEIGMGDNIYLGDRDGVRTPMQWDANRNAGFSDADPQRLHLPLIVSEPYHHQTNNVAAQQQSPHSLLNWMRRLIALRNLHQVFGRGDMTMVPCANYRVLAFVRCWRDEHVLVVANLSRFVQHAPLDLTAYEGLIPIEMFGRTQLPRIDREPYPVLLGAHAVMWLRLADAGELEGHEHDWRRALLAVNTSWRELFEPPRRADLEFRLAQYAERALARFSRGRIVLGATCVDVMQVGTDEQPIWPTLVRAEYATGEPQTLLVCLACRSPEAADVETPGMTPIAQVRSETRDEVLTDAMQSPEAATALLAAAAVPGGLRGAAGVVTVSLDADVPADALRLQAQPIDIDRPSSNSVLALGERLVVKLYRHIETGTHPEVEIGRFLRRRDCRFSGPFLGSIRYEWRDAMGRQQATLGVLHEMVPNTGDAWTRSVETVHAFLERAVGSGRHATAPTGDAVARLFSHHADAAPDHAVAGLMDEYLAFVDRLAARVAQLHRVLASDPNDPAFASEPFTSLARRSMYQRIRSRIVSVLDLLQRSRDTLPEASGSAVATLLERRDTLLGKVGSLLAAPDGGRRIRCHGNLHLGQVLHAADDLVIVDFDGEPGRPVFERRLKRSPLQDVVSLMRSFGYAATEGLTRFRASHGAADASTWAVLWHHETAVRFLAEYRRAMAGSDLLPDHPPSWRAYLLAAWIERTVHELAIEIEQRRGWLDRPLGDLVDVVQP